jgi:Flp pilus assembly protein TadB
MLSGAIAGKLDRMTWQIWYSGRATRGTEHNKRVRGGGTWGDQSRRLYQHQKSRYREEMGRNTWAGKNRRLVQRLHQRERGQRVATVRHHGRTVTAGALVLGAVLLMSPGTRGGGLMILFLTGLVLYVVTKRKRG